jgi:SAM-dependent methyltransferase
MDHSELYAAPVHVEDAESCIFYHRMDIPGHGVVGEQWDLRGGEDAYLGNIELAGKRVLEIGPASGYLTFAMEQRGAQVVAVELAEDQPWDLVPLAGYDPSVRAEKAKRMRRLRNAFWFAHERFGSSARVHYGSAYRIPKALGHFDVAVLAAVLEHLRDPLGALTASAEVADTMVVTELLRVPDTEPIARLAPGPDFERVDTWWYLSPALVERYLWVLGFRDTSVERHRQRAIHRGNEELHDFFTVVGRRT